MYIYKKDTKKAAILRLILRLRIHRNYPCFLKQFLHKTPLSPLGWKGTVSCAPH